jgi:hypothetical protein
MTAIDLQIGQQILDRQRVGSFQSPISHESGNPQSPMRQLPETGL